MWFDSLLNKGVGWVEVVVVSGDALELQEANEEGQL